MNFWWSPLFRTWMTAAWRITCALVSNHRLPQVAKVKWVFVFHSFDKLKGSVPLLRHNTSFCDEDLKHNDQSHNKLLPICPTNSNIPKPPTLWWCEKLWTNPCRDAVAPPHSESSSGACILWLVDPWYSIVRLRDGCENLPYLNPKITAKELRQKQLDRSYDDNRHCWQKATLNTWFDNLWIGCSASDGWSDTLNDLSNWGTEIRAKRHYSVRNIRIIVWRLLQRDTSLHAKLEHMKKLYSQIFSEGNVGQTFPRYQPLFGLTP